jgi:hypothetical protein
METVEYTFRGIAVTYLINEIWLHNSSPNGWGYFGEKTCEKKYSFPGIDFMNRLKRPSFLYLLMEVLWWK